MPVLRSLDSRSKMAVPAVSEPDPAVVETATNGFGAFVMGRPRPRGAFTRSRRSASGSRCRGSRAWPCR